MEDITDAVGEPNRLPEEKRYDLSKVRLARMSWTLPLFCLGITIVINCVAKPLGAAGFVIFAGGVVVGFILAIVSLVHSSKYQGVTGHAIGGLVTTIALTLLIAASFWAVSKLREIQERQRERKPGEQQTSHVTDGLSSINAVPRMRRVLR
jgi:hypothetical protein